MKNKIKVNFLLVALVTPLLATGCDPSGHTHNFDLENPIWNWNNDKTEASLKFKCSGCEEFSEPVVDSDIETNIGTPTCTEGATSTYTASVEYGGKTYTETKTEDVDALGHNFTSITVSGVNNDGYDALTAVTGLTVTKVCSNGHSVVADSSEIVIDYAGNDNVLHYGDTSITVRIKNTNLSKDVALTVKKISVTKPTADTAEFVYNQNEQEYTIVGNNYYSVTGNKKTNAGTSQVIVSLINKTDFEWAGGGTDDITFDFVISKATPEITGMKDSYTLDCHDALDISDISTNLGSLEVKLYDSNETVVDDLTALKGGTYTLKASVAGDDNINGAEVSSIVEVTHTYDLENPIWNWNNDKTEASLKFECTGCGDYSEPVTDDDIKTVPGTPTCMEGATTTYEASVEYGGKTYTNTKEEGVSSLGHDFTSITVTGINAEGYNALSTITGLTVTKVCSRCGNVVASEDEIIIEYASEDNVLHYGDTSVTVKIKNTDLSLEVPVVVNKISVAKPTADTTEFVYNQNEQEYAVAANNCYTVTGNKKTNAGTTQVTVSLNSKTDYEWVGGGNEDVTFDFTISKATATISGINPSYIIQCGGALNTSEITTNIGNLDLKLYDSSNNVVSNLSNLKGGDYTLKASVASDDNIIGAEFSAPVFVSHVVTEFTVPAQNTPGSKIGYKTGTCTKCGETAYVPMNEGEINKDYGFGFGAGGATDTVSNLTSEYPGLPSRSAYRVYQMNNSTVNAALPRINFTAFSNVVISFRSNSTDQHFIGLGYAEEDDLFDFSNHGVRASFALNCTYDKANNKVIANVAFNNGLKNQFVIQDENVINGNSSLVLKVHGGAWRSILIDNILLDHTCSSFTAVSSIVPGVSEICDKCYQAKANNSEIVYDRDVLNTNPFVFKTSNSAIGFGVDDEDVGALKVGGSQGSTIDFVLTMPTIDYKTVKNATYTFSCNAGSSYIGFDDSTKVQTVSNTKSDAKGTISLEYSDGELAVTISTDGSDGKTISKVITDTSIINGYKPISLYASLAAWNYFAFSKLVLNKSAN